MLALSLYLLFGGYALFLLGFAIFMYFENRKFGDNQFVMKLLPPPGRSSSAGVREAAGADVHPGEAAPLSDWTAVPVRTHAPARGERVSQAA